MSGMNMSVPTMSSTSLFLEKERWPQSWPTTNHCSPGCGEPWVAVQGWMPGAARRAQPPRWPSPRRHPPKASTHPGQRGARQGPGKGQQRGGADGDEVQGGGERRNGGGHRAPCLPHVELENLRQRGTLQPVMRRASRALCRPTAANLAFAGAGLQRQLVSRRSRTEAGMVLMMSCSVTSSGSSLPMDLKPNSLARAARCSSLR